MSINEGSIQHTQIVDKVIKALNTLMENDLESVATHVFAVGTPTEFRNYRITIQRLTT